LWTQLRIEGWIGGCGELAKLGRWNQAHDKHEIWRRHRGVNVIAMTQLGIERKWYADVTKSPLFGFFLEDYSLIDGDEIGGGAGPVDVNDDAESQVARGSNDPPAIPRGVKHSNETLSRKRSSYKNTLDFSSHIFADDQRMKRMDIMWETQDPVILTFKAGLTQCKTIQGHFDYFLGLSRGGLSQALERSWQKLTDGNVLLKIGFSTIDEVCESKRKADMALAQLCLDALRHLTRQFVMWEYEFTHGLPFQFLRLLSCDQNEVTAVTRTDFHIYCFPFLPPTSDECHFPSVYIFV
jgi:hypothetical protein